MYLRGKGKRLGLPGFPPFFWVETFAGIQSRISTGFLRARGGVLKPCQDRAMTRPGSLSHLVGGAERDGCGGGFSRRGVKRGRISGDRGKLGKPAARTPSPTLPLEYTGREKYSKRRRERKGGIEGP